MDGTAEASHLGSVGTLFKLGPELRSRTGVKCRGAVGTRAGAEAGAGTGTGPGCRGRGPGVRMGRAAGAGAVRPHTLKGGALGDTQGYRLGA